MLGAVIEDDMTVDDFDVADGEGGCRTRRERQIDEVGDVVGLVCVTDEIHRRTRELELLDDRCPAEE